MSGMPKDVKDSLIASGVKFDEDGNMIDEPIIKSEDDQVEEDQVEDEDQETEEIEDEDVDDDSDDDASDDTDTDTDDEEEEPKEEVKKPKLTNKEAKKALTPKKEESEKEKTDNSQLILDKIAELQALQDKAASKKEPKPKTTERTALELMEEEARKFKQMSMQRLAAELEREVNRRFSEHGVSYKEIINSEEWDKHLSKTKYGVPIQKFYVDAINNADWNTMLDFFDEFAHENLSLKQAKEEAKSEKPSKKLDDLAVPENSKSTRKPKRRAKFDFEADDYSKKLNEFERGKISYTEFAEFEQKFDKALSAGRVKPAN